MRVISVVGLKGGSGKTSTAVPLAYEASRKAATVLLDIDPTPSATEWIEAARLTSETLVGHRAEEKTMKAELRRLRDSSLVEYAVIDTPPVSRSVCMEAAGEADVVVIPVHIGSGDLAQLVQTLDLLDMPKRANPDLKVLVVLNHAGTMPALTRETRTAVEGLGVQVAKIEIPYRKAYATAKGSKPTAEWWHFGDLWKEVRGLL